MEIKFRPNGPEGRELTAGGLGEWLFNDVYNNVSFSINYKPVPDMIVVDIESKSLSPGMENHIKSLLIKKGYISQSV